jgi:hypothetical protein
MGGIKDPEKRIVWYGGTIAKKYIVVKDYNTWGGR